MNIMELRQSLDCLFLIYQMVYCILKATYIKDKYIMIDEKIIMGVRNKNADAKKELISLTRNHLVQTIYKRYIGLEEKDAYDGKMVRV